MQVDVEAALKAGKNYRFPEQGDKIFGLFLALANSLQASSNIDDRQWNQAWSLVEGAFQTCHRDRALTFALDLLSIGQGKRKFPRFYSEEILPILNENNLEAE